MTAEVPAYINDESILKILENKNACRYGVVYKYYAPEVFGFLYAMMDDPLPAENLTEEVFNKVWHQRKEFLKGDDSFKVFVFRSARKHLIGYHKEIGKNMGADEVVQAPLGDPSQGSDDQTQAIEFLKEDDHDLLRNKLALVRGDRRTVLVLRFLSALSIEETARVMGTSPDVIQGMQHQALADLRVIIGVQAEPVSLNVA